MGRQVDDILLQQLVRHYVRDNLPGYRHIKAARDESVSGGFRCEQLQHVHGARPVTGPVGLPDSHMLTGDNAEQGEAAGLWRYIQGVGQKQGEAAALLLRYKVMLYFRLSNFTDLVLDTELRTAD